MVLQDSRWHRSPTPPVKVTGPHWNEAKMTADFSTIGIRSWDHRERWTHVINLKLLRDFPGGPLWQIHQPVQRTWVWPLVWEDPTCWRATKPMFHKYWAHILNPTSHNYWAYVLQCLKPAHLEPVYHNAEESLLAAPRESLHVETKIQLSQKYRNQ